MQYYLVSTKPKRKDFIFEVWMNLVRVNNTYAENKISDLREIHHIKLEQFCKSNNAVTDELLSPFRQITAELVALNLGVKELSNEQFMTKWLVIKRQLETAMERV